MIDKKEIVKELVKEFEASKKEFGFKVTFEEIDKEYSFKNAILNKGFVPENLPRVLCVLIAQDYRDWQNYLNSLLLPSGSSYANQTEAKLFSSEADKKMLWGMVKKCMQFSSESSLSILTQDKKLMGEFIDTSFNYWIKDFKPKMIEIIRRVNGAWKQS